MAWNMIVDWNTFLTNTWQRIQSFRNMGTTLLYSFQHTYMVLLFLWRLCSSFISPLNRVHENNGIVVSLFISILFQSMNKVQSLKHHFPFEKHCLCCLKTNNWSFYTLSFQSVGFLLASTIMATSLRHLAMNLQASSSAADGKAR